MTSWMAVAVAPHAGADPAPNASSSVPAAVHGMGPSDAGDVNAAKGSRPGGGGSANLLSHGGPISHAPAVVLVFWGTQWNNNDPSGEAAYVTNFLTGVGATETWSASTTQYCSGVASGTTNCATASGTKVFVQQPGSALLTTWSDNTVTAPSSPSQSQLASEAVRAANHLSIGPSSDVQFVIATAHGNNASGFGVQYCAWHSSVSANGGTYAYTNLPYMTDAGASCGQNFVNSGTAGLLDGVSIVEGHEYAETVTDPYPSSGWLDSRGAENGDKCAWKSPGSAGGSFDLVLSGKNYAVQTLWSNNFNNSAGGCVALYTSASNQSQFG
jgi:serine protease